MDDTKIVIGVDENGKRKVKTFYDRDWRVLDKKVREFTISLEQGRYVDSCITLGQCVEMWIQGRNDVCAGTQRGYRAMQHQLQPIAHIKMDKIKPAQIEYLYADLYAKGIGASIRNLSCFLKRIYRFAINNQFASINVAERARTPKIAVKGRRALTEEERGALLKAFDIFSDFEKAFVGIAYYAGLRRNEILALTKNDIDFENNIISVNKTLVVGDYGTTIVQNHPKSKAGIRKVAMCKSLRDILMEYTQNTNLMDNRLFVMASGRNITHSTFDYRWKGILRKINRFMPNNQSTNITPHYLRHNWATDLIYAGVPLKSVQYMMGHEILI